MKKLFAIAFIAVSFAACNSAETKTEEAAGAATEVVTEPAGVVADSLAGSAARVDSTSVKTKVDSLKK